MLRQSNNSTVTDVPHKQHRSDFMDLSTDQLDYHLPEHLIATEPIQPRDAARMLVLHRQSDQIEHRRIRDLPEYLHPNDAMVFNTTAVTPARLVGQRADSGGRVQGLYLGSEPDGHWQVMLKSNSRLRQGQHVQLLDPAGNPSKYILELLHRRDELWIVRGITSHADAQLILDDVGRTPLPPYILRARGEHAIADALDRSWYQTIFASSHPNDRRSVAAPTAGLHFTPQLLQQLDKKGVQRLSVLLHVGAGTFKPISVPTIAQHKMHSEHFHVPHHTLEALRQKKQPQPSNPQANGRIIAVGTTTVRTLESLPLPLPENSEAVHSHTDLLIAPPYSFRYVDAMLTNFHLPRSTLLALVAAMVGLDRLKTIYAQAVQMGYRFYSYGDAMLVL